jgi:hypothetical protein
VSPNDLTGFQFFFSLVICRRNKALIEELSAPPPGSSDLNFATQYSRSFFTQCLACLWKQKKSYWRNPSYTAVRLLFTIVIALMFGTMFWDLGRKTCVHHLYIAFLFYLPCSAVQCSAVQCISLTPYSLVSYWVQ